MEKKIKEIMKKIDGFNESNDSKKDFFLFINKLKKLLKYLKKKEIINQCKISDLKSF